jgi:hypothetical protein
MRKPGDWYVADARAEVVRDALLAGEYGNVATPQEAVDDHWRKWTAPGVVLVTDAMDIGSRKHWHWNGYRWVDMKWKPSQEPSHV